LACSMAIFTLLNAATISWDNGGDGMTWSDATNWTGDVLPTASDDVEIDGYTVIITSSTTVQRIYLFGSGHLTINTGVTLTVDGYTGNDEGFEVNNSATVVNDGTVNVTNILGGTGADGIYVRGLFNNNGVISIDGIGQHGLYAQRGHFINNVGGTVTITNTGQVNGDGDGIYTDDSSGILGKVTNYGTITVNATSGDDGIYVNDGTSFDNHGVISLVGTSTSDNGIRMDDSGIFNNMAGATFNVDGFNDDQLYVDNTGAIFNNSGTITLTGSDGDDAGLYVIDDGTFVNMVGGVVNINSSLQFGIQLDANIGSNSSNAAEIINNGTMTVTSSVNDGLRLQEGGLFTNTSSGVLNIVTAGDEGIIFENTGTISNSGMIEVLNSVDHAVEMKSGGTLTNNAGGTFKITTPGDKGIVMVAGTTLNNSGTIDVDGSVKEGIDMVDGTFNNNTGGVYKARNVGDDGLEINGPAIFNNDGHLDIDGSGSEDIEVFYGPNSEFPGINNTANSTLTPGSSPGDLEIKGDYDLGATTITFEIDGTTPIVEYDQILNTAGTNFININTAKAIVDFGSFVPSVGDDFQLIDGSGITIGSFSSVTILPASIVATVTNTGTEMQIVVTEILPVEFAKFEAKETSRGNRLDWQTASEINNEGFNIERSIDGRNWSKLGTVKGQGESHKIVEYTFLDKLPSQGVNYYRLKQLDFDGNFDYSDIVSVTNRETKNIVNIYPNPVNNTLFIESNNTNLQLELYDVNGQLIWQNNGVDTKQIPFNNFEKGIYFLEIVNNNERTIQKIVK